MDQVIENVLQSIQEQVEDQVDGVQEINLDQHHFGKFNSKIAEALEKHAGDLLFLSLNDCGLTTLENFPKLTKLIRLELTDNKLHGDQLKSLANLKDLQSLSLGGNPIANYDELAPLVGLQNLVQLDLFGCPISEKSDYREKIFSMFKDLKILDNQDPQGNDVEYDEDEEGEGEEGEDEYEGEEDEEEGEGEEEEGDEEEDEEDEDDDEDAELTKKKVKKH